MGKPSAKTQVVEYLMSIHIGVSHSLDAITGVYVNEKEAWSGRSEDQEEILINKPDLFGGQTKEGGLKGYMVHLPGREDQVMPDNLAARYGRTSETSPAYRGLTSLFFVGGGAVVSGQTNPALEYWGLEDIVPLAQQNAGGAGFSWSYNSPIIAQNVWVRGERKSKTPLNQAHVMIGPDSNPAHIIAECLINSAWGMGASPSTLDLTSFNQAAATLAAENFGMSLKWMRQAKIEDFIGEIQDHIQGARYLNPRTGLWELRLLRDDYDVSSLRTIDATNAKLTNYRKRLWGETGNQVTVTFTDSATEEEASVTFEDLGAIASQGSVVNISRNYYGIRNADLAYRVAQRDTRAASAPLVTATAEVDRSFWDVGMYDVVLLNWPEKHINNLVMRVMNVDRGEDGRGAIRLSLLEDVFSLEKPPVASPQSPGWENPGRPPEPIDAVEVITLPSYFSQSADLQTAAIDLEYPEVLAAVLAYQENPDVRSYALYAEEIGPGGTPVFRSHGAKSIIERTVLPTGMLWATESRLDDAVVLNRVRGPRVGGFVFLGAGSDANMEICQITGFDEVEREWILSRGVLDTVPRSWPAGTPAWFVNIGASIVDEVALRSLSETVEFKILPRTSQGVLPLEDAEIVSDTMTARPHLPLRPANVKVNGLAVGVIDGSAATELLITWSTRNRLLEDGQVVAWAAGSVAPEYEQGTVVSVYDQGGNLVYEQWGLWTEQQLTLQRSWFNRYSSITIRVSSRRRDLDSLQAHAFVVTGLPADPGAPLPPTPPLPGPPPSPDPAPAAGAWSATGSQFIVENGEVAASTPAILVSGQRDRPTAVGLVVRYTRAAPEPVDWFYLPELALDDQPTQTGTTAVAPQTTYTVEVAYRSASNILSAWRSLGNVTTGQAIAQNVTRIGGRTAAEAVEAIEAIAELGDGSIERARQRIASIRSGNENLAVSAFHAAADLAARRDYTDIRTKIDAEWVGAYAKRRTEELFTETEALALDTTVLAVAIDDANASILDAMLVAATADEAIVELLTAAQAEIDDNYAAFLDEVTLTTTRFDAQATSITALETQVDDAFAAISSEATVRSSQHNAQASLINTLFVDVGGLEGSISFYASALADLEDGVDLMYGFALNSNGDVVGMRAGISGGVGSLLFVAEEIGFVDPSGLYPKYIFSYSGSQLHLTNTVVDGNLVVNGSISGQKILGGAVTNVEAYENAGVMGLTVGVENTHLSFDYVSEGGAHVLQNYVEIGTTGSGAAGSVMRLYCNSVLVGYASIYCPGSWGGTGVSFPVKHVPGPGTKNYAVTYQATTGSGPSRANRSLSVLMELKK